MGQREKRGYFIHFFPLKTRTPDHWGECNNIHVSIVLRDWSVGIHSHARLCRGGGYMSIPLFMHLSTRGGSNPLFFPPQLGNDDAAVSQGHKCMRTVLHCFFFFFLKCFKQFSRQRKRASGTTTAEGGKEEEEEEEKHAKGTSSNKLNSKSRMGLFISTSDAVGRNEKANFPSRNQISS